MTAQILVAFICLLIVAGTAVYCVNSLIKALRGQTISHDRCHEQAQSMLQMSTVRAEAQALRRAATLWDSVEEQHEIRVLAREQFVEDGPSVVALWLRQQATKLDGKTHD